MASMAARPAFRPPTTAAAFTPLHPHFHLHILHHHQHPRKPAAAISCSIDSHYRRPSYTPNHIPDPKYIRIFDTTLRDGEQSPGATMTTEEKLDIAKQLAKLGVDIIEAGFPASSAADLEAVKLIASEVGTAVDEDGYVPVICGLARCNKRDIDLSWEAVRGALRPRIHTFIATSRIHMEDKLKMTKEVVVEKARSMVAYARSLGCDDVEFSPEDAGRSDKEFLYKILGEVIKAGATTLNIPDTVGCTVPHEFGQLIADIKANTPGIENVIISTHCQNDLGLSTANTLAGACAGARQVEVTINGIGERAGNAAFEEVVMAIKCRGEVLNGLYTGINTKHLVMTSKMVEEYSGLALQRHKAVVGQNAFAHESGIHQDGMLKNTLTYEFISAEDIGLHRTDKSGIVLGKLSGRHALGAKLSELGYDIDGKELDDLFWRFKAIAQHKKNVTDDDLMALVSDEVFQPQVVWKLGDVQVTCGSTGLPTATIRLIDADGEEHIACQVGMGPVDSAYKAIDLIVKVPVILLEYSLIAVTEGIDAIATTRVLIRAEKDDISTHASTGENIHRTYRSVSYMIYFSFQNIMHAFVVVHNIVYFVVSGTGASMDIVISSVRAYIGALNKLLGHKNRLNKDTTKRTMHV
ncbi:hypothetical protein RJ639_042159 [Escallonia herrerae]|uniref:2-isopropylmalate synthase n=1 Tax=Escallonia herrerae TaxID=1293975 RepID=A0AA88WHL5_9ASTE|nr:hypothetical protein RJ639_042159 [Escallonia herrerae]